jgi:xanthine dehydrogenase accessory factor
MESIYLHIPHKKTGSARYVLATIISTRGSTPQKPGSSALFDKRGLVYGTIGGGVLEGKVQKIAMRAAVSGKCGVYDFDLDKDISFKSEAICGGSVTVLIDAALEKHASLRHARSLLKRRIPGALMTVISRIGKKHVSVSRFLLETDIKSKEDYKGSKHPPQPRLVKAGYTGDISRADINEPSENDYVVAFLEPLYPPPHLVIAGAGHIGKALCHIGKRLGFDVTVIDDRRKFANRKNIPDADNLIVKEIGKAMEEVEKTPDTYIVIVTRGHSDDSKALKSCIGSQAAYVGMIGSKTKIAQMHTSFVSNKLATEEQWAAVHAPIGLKINSKSVEEIAVSIAAEIIHEKNKKE